MEKAAARQHPVGRVGRRIAAGFGLTGLALLAATFALPLMVSHRGERATINGPGVVLDGACCVEPTWHWVDRILAAYGLLFVLLGVAAAVLAAGRGWLSRLAPGGTSQDRSAAAEKKADRSVDLGSLPEALHDIVTAARQLGYEPAAVARSSKGLVVHMASPLKPEDRQALILRRPTLGRWYFSGDPHTPPDEGFRDAESGAAISFPVRPQA